MMKSNVTALTLAGILSVSSMAVFAQSSGGNPPVDKGGDATFHRDGSRHAVGHGRRVATGFRGER